MAADETYGNFTQDLYDAEKNHECRFAVFDVEYVELTGMPRNKIVFLMWSVTDSTGLVSLEDPTS